MTILFFCREIYAFGQGVFYFTRITRLPFGWQSYSFVEKYMLSLSQGVFYCTKTAWLPFGWQSYSFVRIMHNLRPRPVWAYKNSATTFRMTILFFCREIYAWSWPRRVYFTNANFRMTILFFCREIYACLPKVVKNSVLPFGWQSYSFVR